MGSAVDFISICCHCQLTLKIIWISSLSPSLPGYFPTRLVAVKSNKLAPVSVQMAWISMFLPVPRGPANNIDFTSGAFSWTAGEAVGKWLFSLAPELYLPHRCFWSRSLESHEWLHSKYGQETSPMHVSCMTVHSMGSLKTQSLGVHIRAWGKIPLLTPICTKHMHWHLPQE